MQEQSKHREWVALAMEVLRQAQGTSDEWIARMLVGAVATRLRGAS